MLGIRRTFCVQSREENKTEREGQPVALSHLLLPGMGNTPTGAGDGLGIKNYRRSEKKH